ncbi:MAG: phosphoribosyltransferase [Gaiellaceae bacterium]
MRRFRNRAEAGRALAERLEAYAGRDDVTVLGLPRGGVPVAAEVARALGVPLDVFLVRKLGVPGREELAFGAIASGGARVLNRDVVATLGIDAQTIDAVVAREQAELERRAEAYRGTAEPPELRGRVVILVDDGLATGASMRAAVEAVRALGPARVVVAVPVAARQTCEELAAEVDEVVCLMTPEPFFAVGMWYADFSETTDDDVRELLRGSSPPNAPHSVGAPSAEVELELAGVTAGGTLTEPEGARALVLFAHGSGSSRFSPRNRAVADVLHAAGLATLLLDLLPEEGVVDRRFDIELLGERVTAAVDWAEPRGLPLGLFGASTGAAAALVAAAERPELVRAVVSRGGRPDLAGQALPLVRAPTLLIVGGDDPLVLGLNREAMARMEAEVSLEVVPGATHLFEEPGTLDRVAELARDWLVGHL